MRKVLIEVKFLDTNEIKSFQATAMSLHEALKEAYKMLNEYNENNSPYDVLCILKTTYQNFCFHGDLKQFFINGYLIQNKYY